MTRFLNRFFILLALISLLGSCRNLYIQKSVFVPQFKEKGDVRVEGVLGREGASFNTAYAFSDKFGAMLNGFSSFDNSSQYHRKYNYQLEGGLGYYKGFRDSLQFESFAGVSRGFVDANYERPTLQIDDYNKFALLSLIWPIYYFTTLMNAEYVLVNARGSYYTAFFQNSLTISSGGNSFSLTGRAQYITYYSYQEEIITPSGKPLWYGINVPGKLFIQPAATARFKLGKNSNLYATTQVGLNIDPQSTFEVFEWNTVYYYFGIGYGFNTRNLNRTGLR